VVTHGLSLVTPSITMLLLDENIIIAVCMDENNILHIYISNISLMTKMMDKIKNTILKLASTIIQLG
jgi:hypothetical protein